MDKINASKPEVRDKILFVNSHTKLRDDMYIDNSEFRPTLFLSLSYQINEMLNTGVFFSHLSIYDSSWEYSILLGIAWNFSKN